MSFTDAGRISAVSAQGFNWFDFCRLYKVFTLIYINTDAEAANSGRALDTRINDYLSQMDSVIKHLNDINSYSKINLDQRIKNLSLRETQAAYPEEKATFPVMLLPRKKNVDFYGRTVELQNINDFLHHESKSLRTYTIYGRRGVGKTDLALEYAYTNTSRFDAVFWVKCETSVGLRQSFADIAIALNIPWADRNGEAKAYENVQLANHG